MYCVEVTSTQYSDVMKWLRFNDTVMQVFTTRARNVRASVKLFELRVRTPGGLFWGIWYAGVYIFGVFVRQAFDLRRNFRPTRSDEDV